MAEEVATKSETGWSTTQPEQQGWYWLRSGPLGLRVVVEFFPRLMDRRIASVRYPGMKGLMEVTSSAEWLGPITPTDAEQLERLREAAEKAAAWIEAQTWPCQHSDQPMRCSRCASRQKAKELSTALRYALGTQEK